MCSFRSIKADEQTSARARACVCDSVDCCRHAPPPVKAKRAPPPHTHTLTHGKIKPISTPSFTTVSVVKQYVQIF